jgi:hypothetical protein
VKHRKADGAILFFHRRVQKFFQHRTMASPLKTEVSDTSPSGQPAYQENLTRESSDAGRNFIRLGKKRQRAADVVSGFSPKPQ